jgi:hypothetical protein
MTQIIKIPEAKAGIKTGMLQVFVYTEKNKGNIHCTMMQHLFICSFSNDLV